MASSAHIRTCHVVKTPEEEFEFFLRVDEDRKGQIVTSITPEGPADRAGLKDGDRLIEVNGVNVEKKSHAEVVAMIKESMPKDEIKFEVVDKEHDPNNHPPETNGGVKATPPDPSELRPRLCKIYKKRNTFGFNLEAQGPDKPGHFIKEVADGGPGMESGLRSGDRIIEVGGTNITKMHHAKVVSLIKKGGNKVTLLVVDDATFRHYTARKMKIKAKRAYSTSDKVSEKPRSSIQSDSSSQKSPIKSTSSMTSFPRFSDEGNARLVHVIKGKDRGYGFFLRVKKGDDGEYIGEVESGKSAERCGLIDNDRVLAVNGKVILTKTHDEVVQIVKSNPYHVVFLVLGPNAIENAKKNGLLSTLTDAKVQTLEKPRTVTLAKGKDGYGFYLKMETGRPRHVIADVEDDSPGGKEGLKNGDILVSVEGENIMKASHDDCVNKIKAAGNKVKLTVAKAETANILYDLDIPLTDDIIEKWPDSDVLVLPNLNDHKDFFGIAAEEPPRPAPAATTESKQGRICTLKKEDDNYGFFLRDDSGHYLSSIEENAAAHLAGVRENDRILEVNGANVENETHEQVVERIRRSGDEVTFLVISDNEGKTKAETSVAAAFEDDRDRPLPRYCELEKTDTGFGFHLNAEENERSGQYIQRIVAGGVAEKAGLKEGDRVIEVNGINIHDTNHDDVVDMIRESGSQVNFLVVDEEADLYYSKKGIQITKALLAITAATAIKEAAADTHSIASSTIEAEATVHAVPDKNEGVAPPELDIPPPPAEEEVAGLIDEAIEEIHSEERREEIIEELQIIAEEVNNTSDDKAIEEVKEELKEEILDEVKEKAAEQIQEEIADEIRDEIREDVKDALVAAATIEVAKEIREEIQDSLEDEIKEDLKEKKETEEEKMERMREEMRKQIEREMREKMEEEMRQKVAAAAVAVPAAPEPPKVVAAALLANAVSQRVQQMPKITVPKTQSTSPAANDISIKQQDLKNAVSALRPVKKSSEVQKGGEEERKDSPKAFTFSSARAMFEGGQNQQQKPSWQRTGAVSVKKSVAEQPNENKTTPVSVTTNGVPKRPQVTKWAGGSITLNIVESSSGFQ